ncbi:gag-protease polyprotein [Cucumis melo var. makuwa]|uniref:Gag-protease polyprotein n=1 Tax=Cucumis melo var. makuwa TaxID=1194695 RepID=A0A5D3C041_CUCMM|nr:gag-protease polyprotein [Cucumis melo var. makuwa]TYK04648.1 gag-protease polyprotein [Cucumis melo var. makuwa]
MLGGDVSKITWEQFKENFYAKFFSANVKHAKLQEFLNLEQGDMTVEQYDAEFDMLSHFVTDVVRDEAARTKKFVRGLRLDLQGIEVSFRGTDGSLQQPGELSESYPSVLPVRESIEVVAWPGAEFASGVNNQDTLLTRVLGNPLRRHRISPLLSNREEFLPLPVRRSNELVQW